MKRALMVLLAVEVAMVCGCKKSPEEGGGGDEVPRPRAAVTAPATTEEVEVVEPNISRGLVGWWKFDEVSGKSAEDSSGQGRSGTLVGEVSFDNASVEGRRGKALKLDREDDYVEIKGYKGIAGTAARTVAAWIKTKRDDGSIVSWGVDEGGKMFKFGFVRGRRRVGVTPKGGYLYMNDKVDDDTWHHVAAVVEEAELPNLHDDVKIYRDGGPAEIHGIGILDLWPIDTGSGLDVMIGEGFEGVVDDVRIYDRPLSEEEIRLLFAEE